MRTVLHRRVKVMMMAALAAAVCYAVMPSSSVDRMAFEWTLRGSINPPYILTGTGTNLQPWQITLMKHEAEVLPAMMPRMISLRDSCAGTFQDSPPSAIDYAVILSNARRIGVKHMGFSSMLAWPAVDPIALAALEEEMAAFDRIVLAAPLARGLQPDALPPSMRRGSLAKNQVRGDLKNLPRVNRVAVPDGILGGENALAGFSILEGEDVRKKPLIAVWDDRVVLSFALLFVLENAAIPIDSIEIELGKSIKLGKSGWHIPIDDYGQLAIAFQAADSQHDLAAEQLIDAPDSSSIDWNAPLFRDLQSTQERVSLQFAQEIGALVAVIADRSSTAEVRTFFPVSNAWQIGILTACVVFLTVYAGKSNMICMVMYSLCAALAILGQWLVWSFAGQWFNALPCLASIAAGGFVAWFTRPQPVLTTLPKPAEHPEPIIQTPPKTPAKKAASPRKSASPRKRKKSG